MSPVPDDRLAELHDEARIRQAEGYLTAVVSPAEVIALVEEVLAWRGGPLIDEATADPGRGRTA